MGAVVRVHNPSDTDWIDTHQNTVYKIPAGADAYLEMGPVIEWMGHPYAYNEGKNKLRDFEAKRLRSRYGVYNDRAAWERIKPQLQVFDPATEERIMTVVDDETGAGTSTAMIVTSDSAAVAQRMLQLEKEMQALRASVAQESTLIASTDTLAAVVPTAPPEAYTPPAPKPKVDLAAAIADELADDNSEVPFDFPPQITIG